MFTHLLSFFSFNSVVLSTYALRQSEQAHKDGCYSRAANYLTAMRAFVNAVGDIPLKDITKKTVNDFQIHLKQRGISLNTISCYNRTLRAIYNRAVVDGLTRDRQPFAKVFTGNMKTVKRSMNEELLLRLMNADLGGDRQLERTRDYFIFSFIAMGMPFIDVAYLQKKQIQGDILVYDRRKTGLHVCVPLTMEALLIINKYNTKASPYVFPILSSTSEPEAYDEYCTSLNNYNRQLKRLAKAVGLTVNLTSYTARHSWASIAYKSDVSLHIISQALGHARPDTTMIYIREIDDDQMRQGNDKVLKTVGCRCEAAASE